MTAKSFCIPTVDFAAWHPNASIEEKKAVAAKLIDGCQRVGFVYIVNHSVSPERLVEAFDMSKKMFSLPKEKKTLAPHPPGFAVHRGYSWPGLEKVSNAMGDEEDKDLAKNLRSVVDVKVWIFVYRACITGSYVVLRRAMKSVAKRTKTNPTSGYRTMYCPASALS